MLLYITLLVFSIFLALNMGGSNFGTSFATAFGSKLINKLKALFLFGSFVFLGAILLGRPVSNTLGEKIIPGQLINLKAVVVIFISASVCLFIANKLHVPQSTSFVTVASILGVGLFYKQIYTKTFLYLIPFWIVIPIVAYFGTYFLGKVIYPPRRNNFWIYEKIANHKNRLRGFVLIASCYNAFSVGTNNVANVVGPLTGAKIFNNTLGLFLVAPLFGIGGFFFEGPLKTAGVEIVPLGLLSSTVICLVTGTLMIIASVLGVPQSFVIIKVASILAISGVKNGHRITFLSPTTRKTYITWMVTPILAVIISYFLSFIFL